MQVTMKALCRNGLQVWQSFLYWLSCGQLLCVKLWNQQQKLLAKRCHKQMSPNRPWLICRTFQNSAKERMHMQIHWSHILFAIIIGYVLGMYFPQIGATVKAKIGAA